MSSKEEFQAAKKLRTAQLSQMTRLYNDVEKDMLSKDNVLSVKEKYSKLCERFEKLKNSHLQTLEVCSDADIIETLEQNFECSKQNFTEFQERYSEWIKSVEEPPEDDRSSQVSGSSSVSSRYKLKCARAKRLIAEIKLKSVKEKHELERKKHEIDRKQEVLEHRCAIEEAKVEETIWQETFDDETGVISDNNSVQRTAKTTSGDENDSDSEVIIVNRSRRSNPTSVTQVNEGLNNNYGSVSGTSRDIDVCDENRRLRSMTAAADVSVPSVDTAFRKLASVLHEGFNLPKPELLTFSGKATEYSKFIKNFETNIESKVCDNSQRLSYLIQYCRGEARMCIEDCVLLEPSAGYRRARDILYSRYGRSHVIARTYIENLVHGPQISASDVEGLSKLSLDMQNCEITLSQLGFACDIDNTENLRRIVRRLPMHMRVKWVDIAHSITESGREARFSDLAKFVEEKSRIASSMYGMDLVRENKSSKVNNKVTSESTMLTVKGATTLTTQSNTSSKNKSEYGTGKRFGRKCLCCHGNCAELSSCETFKALSLEKRKELVRKNKLCYNCLKGNHSYENCRKPKLCTVPECELKHNILLHSWIETRTDGGVTQSSVNCTAQVSDTFITNCLGIIPVTVKGRNGNHRNTYAMLDDGSDKTLCDERLLKSLNIKSKPVTFEMSTVNAASSTNHGQEVDLTVSALTGGGCDEIVLSRVWSVKKLPISARSGAMNVDYRKMSYLSDIEIPKLDNADVTILIGTDAPAAHIPLEVRSGNVDQPYAVRSRLGWAIRGPIKDDKQTMSSSVNVNFQQSTDVLLQEKLEKMWKTDFSDNILSEKQSMSIEDKQALQMMESSLTREDGHYMMGLPWRHEDASLPNNMPLAHARLQQLRNKLSRDQTMHQMYTTTMTDYIEKGYATEVHDIESGSRRVWYLPHHPVTNVNKPGKVRVVFDCAASYKSVSLNSQLLQGPDLMNSLIGVLLRFRKDRVAIAADIESMFHQVRVSKDDCDALRFLWWPGGDMELKPKCYQMRVHLFGATSSPSCCAYALKRTALDNACVFGPEVVATVQNSSYVDDCLKSVESDEKAISLASNLQAIMKMGGFRLTKWLSNSRKVLNAIPESERAKSVVNLSLQETLPCDRALGVLWDVNDDRIRFKVKVESKPLTRRGILSIVSSIYDPLGLISPVTLQAKAIIQSLCRLKIGWDDQIPHSISNEWRHWLSTLPCLESVSVSRCYQTHEFGNVRDTQLHIFSDGSERGYGACAYLRLTDICGNVKCSLVMGKSRLAPIKQMSIPRLELSGAVVACRLYSMLSEELDMKFDKVTFWTDSTIVLGYINNVSKRFKTFVGNRLSIIHESTSPDQWRHVDTDSNPADIASRGIRADDSQNIDIWLNGPRFLPQDSEYWPKNPLLPEVAENDSEVKKDVQINSVSTETGIGRIIDRYSCWTKLKRSVAWILRYKAYCRRRYLHHKLEIPVGYLSLEEIQNAEHTLLVHTQASTFTSEICKLQKSKPVKIDSSIASLNPVLYDDLIRVQGRSQRKHPSKCPIILPKNHAVTTLIARNLHENNGHVGRNHLLAITRKKYWILHGPSAMKNIVKNCLLCRRLHSPLMTQQMAPLLEEQTTPHNAPFTNIGIDFFGPLVVKSGRSQAKRYGCIFTCLACRAVHLEITHSLTTDSFIAAFQRFTGRRGYPKKVYSDNGTNLVSGDRQLRNAIEEWNQSKIEKHMLDKEIQWHFNPPQASHCGGVWERLVRSTRTILKALVKQQLLTDEQLVTLMVEAERILNDRPLAQVSDDPEDLSALSPNMLLLMKSNDCTPKGIYKRGDTDTKRWWRQAQYLVDIFWRRWVREYLPTLQKRPKWQRQTINLRVGDLVLVSDSNIPRGKWPLGRVVQIKESRDGLVRSCVVKYKDTQTVKPVTKLCLLESAL